MVGGGGAVVGRWWARCEWQEGEHSTVVVECDAAAVEVVVVGGGSGGARCGGEVEVGAAVALFSVICGARVVGRWWAR